jgi:hypothetical protein
MSQRPKVELSMLGLLSSNQGFSANPGVHRVHWPVHLAIALGLSSYKHEIPTPADIVPGGVHLVSFPMKSQGDPVLLE